MLPFHALSGLQQIEFCTSKRAEIMCVSLRTSVHMSRFVTVCLNVCCGAKCKMIATEGREKKSMWGHFESLERDICTHPYTRTHTHCSCDRLTYCHCVLCTRWEDVHQARVAFSHTVCVYKIKNMHKTNVWLVDKLEKKVLDHMC